MAFDWGINFRDTAGYVTDPAGTTYCLKGDSYPTTRTETFGWDATPDADHDRSTGIDARLAGVITEPNAGGGADFRLDLDAAVEHEVRIAMGDEISGQNLQRGDLKDDTTSFNALVLGNFDGGEFYDANGVKRTSAADWVSNNTAFTHTFVSTIFRFELAHATGGVSSAIAHIHLKDTGAGGIDETDLNRGYIRGAHRGVMRGVAV